MTALSTLVEALKRELAVPGTFGDVFPATTDSDLLGALADAFGEAQLTGWFSTLGLTYTAADPSGTPPAEYTTNAELSAAGGALVVIIASMRVIRAQLRNLTTRERYKAGPVEYETERAASVLKSELDYLSGRMKELIASAQGQARASAGMASVFDNYIARDAVYNGVFTGTAGFFPYEWYGR